MTQTPPQVPKPQPRALTDEERSVGLLTNLEYVQALRAARSWRRWAGLAAVLLAGSGSLYGYTLAAQLATQTSLIRPLNPKARQWLEEAHRVSPPTLADLATWRPAGWAAKFPAALQECQKKPACSANLNRYADYLRHTPELKRRAALVQTTAAPFVLAALLALFATREANDWPSWERRQLAENTRRRVKL